MKHTLMWTGTIFKDDRDDAFALPIDESLHGLNELLPRDLFVVYNRPIPNSFKLERVAKEPGQPGFSIWYSRGIAIILCDSAIRKLFGRRLPKLLFIQS